jgi:hypothetical protein
MVSYSSREPLLKLIDPELRHPPLWEVKKILELGVMWMEEHPFLRPQMQDVVQYFVDKVLITNQSTDFDSLFIDLVINPWNDTL